jgi:hypothetical protein
VFFPTGEAKGLPLGTRPESHKEIPSVCIVPGPTNPKPFCADLKPKDRMVLPKSTFHSIGCGDPISA